MQPANTADASIESINAPVPTHTSPAFAVPLSISLPILLLIGGVSFTVLNSIFPVFVIAQELLAQMPPDGVAKVRENAFARCRLTNTLLVISTVSLLVAILLPAALALSKRLQPRALSFLIPVAVGCSVVACIGVFLAHGAMELTSAHTFGMTRTFVAHWFEFGSFGLAVGLSVGLAMGNRQLTMDACQKGLLTGLIAATLFDMISIVMPSARIDALIPGGVLWGSHDGMLIALWLIFLLLPLAIGLRKIGPSRTKTN